MDSGKNPLYNVLVAFSKHMPEIGYCQGMNYLAGLILVGVDFDEVTAFTILDKLMNERAQMASLYEGQLVKLYRLSDAVYSWLLQEEPELEEFLSEQGVPLTTLLAGPFMAIFANIVDIDTALHVLDRLVLQKEDALINIIKQVLSFMKLKMLKIDDSGML